MVEYKVEMRDLKLIFLIGFLLLSTPQNSKAFSIKEFFNFSTSTNNAKSVDTTKTENLQSLRVFEPNKVFADSLNSQTASSKKDSDLLSFETDNNILEDDFTSQQIDDHSDNAVYTVQKGDSINSIASYFGVSVQTIMSYNRKSSRMVTVGEVLEVPTVTGVLYTVQKGDTLDRIAKKYGVDADDVSLYNGLFSGDSLAINDEIFLPGAKEAETPVKKTTKKTTKSSASIANGSTKAGRQWANGDTSHLNTSSDILKYSSLPKYSGYYLLPANGAVRTQKMHGHNGVDLAGKIGTPVMASADGVVRVAKSGGYNFGYGNYIIVTHGNGSETVYAHLSSVNVSPGQSVSRGEQIGKLGNSGNSTGPHIHFEIRGAYNPFAW